MICGACDLRDVHQWVRLHRALLIEILSRCRSIVVGIHGSQVSPISYRVQGTGYFRPALRNWPFDTQRLEVMLEDLDLTISSGKVSFVFCSLGNYTGLSPTVRFPEADKQLSTGVEITEMCWPPFLHP
jgi:hypothetical protein